MSERRVWLVEWRNDSNEGVEVFATEKAALAREARIARDAAREDDVDMLVSVRPTRVRGWKDVNQ